MTTAVHYDVSHCYQPTNFSCAQTSLSMLLKYHGRSITPEELMASVPVATNDEGEEVGSVPQQLAYWCSVNGFDVTMHTADASVVDLAWSTLPDNEMALRMHAAIGNRKDCPIPERFANIYLEWYAKLIESGGHVRVHSYLSSDLIDELLAKGPLWAALSASVLYKRGRSRHDALRQDTPDDIKGTITTHAVVITGVDAAGNYTIADPWEPPGIYTVARETIVAAIASAQIECDNMLMQLAPR